MADYKADYKAMYYHLAGQMSIAIEALEGLVAITERLKKAQQLTEDLFINCDDDYLGDEVEKK